MGFGTLAHSVGRLPLTELTYRLGRHRLDFVQLALTKAISDIDAGPGRLSPGLANYIAEQFDRYSIRIGSLGCYINPIHPDKDERRREIRRFKEHLRFARDFGTSIVATETGELDTYSLTHPRNYAEVGFDVLKATVEELAEEAERWGVFVGIEPVCVHTLSSPDLMLRIMEEVPSGNIGVVFDPCNLLTQENYANRAEFVHNALQRLADRIVLVHLKDVQFRERGRLSFTTPGQGSFDIASFLQQLHVCKPFVDVSIEELGESDIDPALDYVRSLAHRLVDGA